MAIENQVVPDLSYVAGEDLSSYQYYIVGLNTSRQLLLADGDETIAIGVLQNKPQSGEAGSVRESAGISKVKYGGTVTVGARLKASGGKAVVTTTAGDRVIGIAQIAGVLNDVGSVLLQPGPYPKT